MDELPKRKNTSQGFFSGTLGCQPLMGLWPSMDCNEWVAWPGISSMASLAHRW